LVGFVVDVLNMAIPAPQQRAEVGTTSLAADGLRDELA
jgi:hypothetical protein